jgi:hypothetical protein
VRNVDHGEDRQACVNSTSNQTSPDRDRTSTRSQKSSEIRQHGESQSSYGARS